MVAIIGGGVLSVPAVFAGAILYFDRMVRLEYESGARISTDGDTPMIPAVGLTVGWTVLLFVVGAIVGTIHLVRSRARRGAV